MRPLCPFLGLVALAACAGPPGPRVADFPVQVEPRAFYESAHVTVHPSGEQMVVFGELLLVPHFSAHVRALSADGRILAQALAALDQPDSRFRGDPRREASFSATLNIARPAVARMEIGFDP